MENCLELASTGINQTTGLLVSILLIVLATLIATKSKKSKLFIVLLILTSSLLAVFNHRPANAQSICDNSQITTPPTSTQVSDTGKVKLNDDGPFLMTPDEYSEYYVDILQNDNPGDSSFDKDTVDLDVLTPGIQIDHEINDESGSLKIRFTYDKSINRVAVRASSGVINGEKFSIDYNVKTISGIDGGTAKIHIIIQDIVALNDSLITCNFNAVNLLSNDKNLSSAIIQSTVDLDPQTPGQQTSITSANGISYSVDSNGILTATGQEDKVVNFDDFIYYTVKLLDGSTSNIAQVYINNYSCG